MLGQFNNRSANGLGGNLGVNYFITRYIGIGVDNSLGGATGSGNLGGVFDSLQGNLIPRHPIGTFLDSRYLYGNSGLHESLTRLGLRFAF
ncbi:MAG: hypothetical protein BGO12_21860 [Verrucomicrobia bacterium 61-8]|nr:hypothetical protein [Verrucomicrobiota bacterium]OJV15392.1 MAG: hypothetical protein BGO12_21860 [Verrucomicrobia bacterium 61-8]